MPPPLGKKKEVYLVYPPLFFRTLQKKGKGNCRGVRRYRVNDADLITRARHGLELHLIRIVREK